MLEKCCFSWKTREIHDKNQADIKVNIIKKLGFRKRLNVLKPLYLCSNMRVAEGSPIEDVI